MNKAFDVFLRRVVLLIVFIPALILAMATGESIKQNCIEFRRIWSKDYIEP